MIQLESFHSIAISANVRRLHVIVITDPRNTTVHSVTLEYVANIQGPLCLSPFRSQAFRPEGNSFLSGELRYIDGSACDKGMPGTPPPLKQAAIPLALFLLALKVQLFLTSIPFVLRPSWQRNLPQQAISAHSTLF